MYPDYRFRASSCNFRGYRKLHRGRGGILPGAVRLRVHEDVLFTGDQEQSNDLGSLKLHRDYRWAVHCLCDHEGIGADSYTCVNDLQYDLQLCGYPAGFCLYYSAWKQWHLHDLVRAMGPDYLLGI
ncbi:hypothetical protein D3C72_1462380 [compost metagenome]